MVRRVKADLTLSVEGVGYNAGIKDNFFHSELSILDEIEANIGDIQKQADPRIAKYKAKYQKYTAKFHK